MNLFIFAFVLQMSIEDWLRLEIQVEGDKDVLQWTERSSYLHSVFDADYCNQSIDLPRLVFDALVRRAMMPGKKITPGHSDCSQDLLQFLQSRLSCFSQSTPSSSKPWLLLYWAKLRQDHGSMVDPLLWNLVCALPAYLLVGNSASEEGSPKMLNQLIENGWRDTLTDGAWLPKHVTLHLQRALRDPTQCVPLLQFSLQVID